MSILACSEIQVNDVRLFSHEFECMVRTDSTYHVPFSFVRCVSLALLVDLSPFHSCIVQNAPVWPEMEDEKICFRLDLHEPMFNGCVEIVYFELGGCHHHHIVIEAHTQFAQYFVCVFVCVIHSCVLADLRSLSQLLAN